LNPDGLGGEKGGYPVFAGAGVPRRSALDLDDDAIRLFALGRHCVAAVIRAARPARVHLPRYTCHSIKRTLAECGADVRCYSLGDDLLPRIDALRSGDLVIVNNYFGLIAQRASLRGWLRDRPDVVRLVDNTHSIGCANQFDGEMSFVSPRKFLPLTDGGILFDPSRAVGDDAMPADVDASWQRIGWLFRAIDEGGRNPSYAEYLAFRQSLQTLPYARMSRVTQHLLGIHDLRAVLEQRCTNYRRLLQRLPAHPLFADFEPTAQHSPIGFAVRVDDARAAQQRLGRERIYAVRYWPELGEDPALNGVERELLDHTLILPIGDTLSDLQVARVEAECGFR
jgi:hypothetical protein